MRTIRHFEQTLLLKYKEYLEVLEEAMKSASLCVTAMEIFAKLLEKLVHFNYRVNLALMAVHSLAHSDPRVRSLALSAYRRVMEGSQAMDLKLVMLRALSKLLQKKDNSLMPEGVLAPLAY